MAVDIFSSIASAFFLSLKLFFVIVVLMIVYEFYEKSFLFELTKRAAKKPLEKVGISTHASITMVVGFVLGITYGAGILIKNAMEKNMSRKDIILSSVFLAICHAMIEDTLIFVAVGANGAVLFFVRFALALAAIMIIQRMIDLDNR